MVGANGRRWAVRAAVGAWGLALGLVVMVAPTQSWSRQLTAEARGALGALERLAGLREDDGTPSVARPLEVIVIQEGGPSWIRDAVQTALDDDATLRVTPGGPSLLRLQTTTLGPNLALRFSLDRRGWSLARPEPLRVQWTPWVAVLALAVGGVAYRRSGRGSVAWLLIGAAAQLLARVTPWPSPPGPGSWVERWSAGPLGQALLGVARALPERATGPLVALVLVSLGLVAWDHRRTPTRGGQWLGGRLAVGVGVVAWVEASARTGWWGAVTTPSGAAAALLLAFAVSMAWWSRR